MTHARALQYRSAEHQHGPARAAAVALRVAHRGLKLPALPSRYKSVIDKLRNVKTDVSDVDGRKLPGPRRVVSTGKGPHGTTGALARSAEKYPAAAQNYLSVQAGVIVASPPFTNKKADSDHGPNPPQAPHGAVGDYGCGGRRSAHHEPGIGPVGRYRERR